MGLFSKPEIIFLKDDNSAESQLEKLRALHARTGIPADIADMIERDIALLSAGIEGEKQIRYELSNADMDLVVLHDVCFALPDGRRAQIDYFVITPKLMLIIECKNLYGNITVDSHGQFIRKLSYGKRFWEEGIYSPIEQNAKHFQIYKEWRTQDSSALGRFFVSRTLDSATKTLVVLSNPKTVLKSQSAPEDIRKQVIRADELLRTIKALESSCHLVKLSRKDMKEFGESILRSASPERTDYTARYEEMLKNAAPAPAQPPAEPTKETEPERICKRCGSSMVLRTAGKGANAGSQFFGCSKFPKCRYTEPV